MIRLARPELGSTELDRLRAVVESGLLVQGENVLALENAIAKRVGVEHAVAVSSGTAALSLALLVAGIGPSQEVLVPDYTFVATANAVRAVGATPILVDIEPGAEPAYAHLARSCPVSESLAPRVLSLPMHTQLSDDDVDTVCETLRTACEP